MILKWLETFYRRFFAQQFKRPHHVAHQRFGHRGIYPVHGHMVPAVGCPPQGQLRHTGAPGVVLGISGGLDSTLALLVSARAMDLLGRPRGEIVAVTMPCFGTPYMDIWSPL